MASEDIKSIKKWISSFKAWHIAVIIGIFVVLFILQKLGGLGGLDVDRTDYKDVARVFVLENPTIANKLGKITSVSLIGAGGGAGKKSYNSFSVRGEDKSGQCDITLIKENDLWYVETATLATGGAEYNIPVSRKMEKRTIKLFD